MIGSFTTTRRCVATFAFDEFGPLAIRPYAGSAWSQKGRPQRLPANYSKKDGTSQLHACYSVGDDTLWGVLHRRKSQRAVLRALKSIRDQRPDGEMILSLIHISEPTRPY